MTTSIGGELKEKALVKAAELRGELIEEERKDLEIADDDHAWRSRQYIKLAMVEEILALLNGEEI